MLLLSTQRALSEPGYQLLQLDGQYVKWGAPVLGTGARIRYAIVDRPMQFAGAINCPAMGPLQSLLEKSGIALAQFRNEVVAAAELWQAAADLTFEPAEDPSAADILIGAQTGPTGWAFANVFHDRAAEGETARIEKSLICLNPEKPWKIGFGGNAFAYDVRYTIAHEFGHAIGLNHAGPEGQVMSFKYGEEFRVLQPGDLKGAVALYGRPGHPPSAASTVPAAQKPEMGLR
ncbi:MAG TPA: matrixin family metalloprotease [Xanthobacteraceae bacterium]